MRKSPTERLIKICKENNSRKSEISMGIQSLAQNISLSAHFPDFSSSLFEWFPSAVVRLKWSLDDVCWFSDAAKARLIRNNDFPTIRAQIIQRSGEDAKERAFFSVVRSLLVIISETNVNKQSNFDFKRITFLYNLHLPAIFLFLDVHYFYSWPIFLSSSIFSNLIFFLFSIFLF